MITSFCQYWTRRDEHYSWSNKFIYMSWIWSIGHLCKNDMQMVTNIILSYHYFLSNCISWKFITMLAMWSDSSINWTNWSISRWYVLILWLISYWYLCLWRLSSTIWFYTTYKRRLWWKMLEISRFYWFITIWKLYSKSIIVIIETYISIKS